MRCCTKDAKKHDRCDKVPRHKRILKRSPTILHTTRVNKMPICCIPGSVEILYLGISREAVYWDQSRCCILGSVEMLYSGIIWNLHLRTCRKLIPVDSCRRCHPSAAILRAARGLWSLSGWSLGFHAGDIILHPIIASLPRYCHSFRCTYNSTTWMVHAKTHG